VSSPLTRCRQTAEPRPPPRLDVAVEPGPARNGLSVRGGLTSRRYGPPPGRDDRLARVPSVAPRGGESFADVTRGWPAPATGLLTAYPGRTVLLVSHVTPIKTLVRLASGPRTRRCSDAPRSGGAVRGRVLRDGNVSLRLLQRHGSSALRGGAVRLRFGSWFGAGQTAEERPRGELALRPRRVRAGARCGTIQLRPTQGTLGSARYSGTGRVHTPGGEQGTGVRQRRGERAIYAVPPAASAGKNSLSVTQRSSRPRVRGGDHPRQERQPGAAHRSSSRRSTRG